jgi:hypothetical protein
VLVIIAVIFLFLYLYSQHTTTIPIVKNITQAGVFNEHGIYFDYPLNWTLVNYSYYSPNNSSKLLFTALLVPNGLVGKLVYPNDTFIQKTNVTNFSDVSITIFDNITLNSLYKTFIFNVSYINNNTFLAGYPAIEGVIDINAYPVPSSTNKSITYIFPKSESVTYISDNNLIGYVLGGFFSVNLNKSTNLALSKIAKTLKYSG